MNRCRSFLNLLKNLGRTYRTKKGRNSKVTNLFLIMYDRNSLQCDGNDVSNYYLKTHYYKIQKILLLLLLYIYNILFIIYYLFLRTFSL